MLAFTRGDKQETVLCAFNNSEEPQRLELGCLGALEPLLGRAHVDVEEGGVYTFGHIALTGGVAVKAEDLTEVSAVDALVALRAVIAIGRE